MSGQPLMLTHGTEEMAEVVMVTNRDGVIEYVNRAFEEASGYARMEVIGQRPRILKSGVHEPAVYRHLWATILRGNVYRGVLINRRKDGQLFCERKLIIPIADDCGRIARFIAIGIEVAQPVAQREQLDEEMGKLGFLASIAPGWVH